MPHTRKTKAANGDGSLHKETITKPNGKQYTYWVGRVTTGFDPKTGRQKQRKISGKTRTEVLDQMRAAQVQISEGTYVDPSKLTMDEWLTQWLAECTGNVKPRTFESFSCQVENHIRPALGSYRLKSLTPEIIQRFVNDLKALDGGELKPKTIKTIHGVLHKSLEEAVRLKKIPYNPATGCVLPRIPKKKDYDILGGDDVSGYMGAIEEDFYANVLLFTMFSGLRKGEVLGLTWDKIDLEKGTMLVDVQLSYYRDRVTGKMVYEIADTKEDNSRLLALAPFMIQILLRQQSAQDQWKAAAGEAWQPWQGHQLVFTNELGGHLCHQTVYRHYKKVVAQIGHDRSRFHDLRHSYAVFSIQAGDDPKTLQDNMGLYTAAFALDRYAQLVAGMKKASADRMEDFFQNVSSR